MRLIDKLAVRSALKMIIDLIVYIVDRLAPPKSKSKKK